MRGGWPTSCPAPEPKAGGEARRSRRSGPGRGEARRSRRSGPGQRSAAKAGGTLKLRDLATGTEQEIPFVAAFAFAPSSKFLAFVVSGADGKGNGVFLKPLAEPQGLRRCRPSQADKGKYESLAVVEGRRRRSPSSCGVEKPAASATLALWQAGWSQAKAGRDRPRQAPKGWTLPLKNDLAWSKDGKRLFFGFKPPQAGAADDGAEKAEKKDDKDAAPDPYDFDAILAKVEGDVWHWNDPRIIPQQKMHVGAREGPHLPRGAARGQRQGGRSWRASTCPTWRSPRTRASRWRRPTCPTRSRRRGAKAPATSSSSNLETGARTTVAKQLRGQPSLSPDGRFVAFFDDGQWQLFDTAAKTDRESLTAALGVTLADEEHDTPDTPPAYGLGGWVDQGASLLVYDRYDIWQIPTAGGAPVNLTGKAGRAAQITFRVVTLDPENRGRRQQPRAAAADGVPQPREELGLLRGVVRQAGRRARGSTRRSCSSSSARRRRPTRCSTPARTTASSPTCG